MKNLKSALLLTFIFFTTTGFSQSLSDWMDILDGYCEEHFEDCFGWDYIAIEGITDFDKISDSKVKIKGKVRNTGYFGAEVIREFIADIRIYSNRTTINFRKQGKDEIRGTYWNDCENSIYY